jgi:hypothetical protein
VSTLRAHRVIVDYESEIKITTAMIRAGKSVLAGYNLDFDLDADVIYSF